MTRSPDQLRSNRWFGPDSLRGFGHRSRIKQMGYSREDFVGRPVVAIVNTWSDLANCHSHFRDRAQQVRHGVWSAGGVTTRSLSCLCAWGCAPVKWPPSNWETWIGGTARS